MRIILLATAAILVFPLPLGGQCFDAELRWEVGAPDGAEWETWMQIIDGLVLDSALFVLDVRMPALRRFDLSGRFLGRVGGKGGGPGEFALPRALEESANGFTVLDQMQRRITEYDLQGNHVDQTTLSSRSSAPNRAWRVRGGWNVGYYIRPAKDDTSWVGVWRDESPPDTLITLENAFVQIRFATSENTFIPGIGYVEGVNGGASVLGDSALVVVDRGSVLRVFEPEGPDWVETRRDTLPVSPERFSRSDHDFVFDIIRAGAANDPRLVDPEFPEFWPTWTFVQGSSAGVWLKQGGREGSILGHYPERWWLWHPDSGAKLGVVLPAGTQAIRFSGDRFVIGKRTDDLDVEVLQFFELVPRLDPLRQPDVLHRPLRRPTLQPRIIAAGGDLQHSAHRGHRKLDRTNASRRCPTFTNSKTLTGSHQTGASSKEEAVHGLEPALPPSAVCGFCGFERIRMSAERKMVEVHGNISGELGDQGVQYWNEVPAKRTLKIRKNCHHNCCVLWTNAVR